MLGAANIPLAWLPHPALSHIYWIKPSTVSFHCLPSLVSPTWLHPFGGFGANARLIFLPPGPYTGADQQSSTTRRRRRK